MRVCVAAGMMALGSLPLSRLDCSALRLPATPPGDAVTFKPYCAAYTFQRHTLMMIWQIFTTDHCRTRNTQHITCLLTAVMLEGGFFSTGELGRWV